MTRHVLLALLVLSGVALAPSASALAACPPTPSVVQRTHGLACSAVAVAQDLAAIPVAVAACLLNTAPVAWVADCTSWSFGTNIVSQATTYALCYGNTGVLHWTTTCT